MTLFQDALFRLRRVASCVAAVGGLVALGAAVVWDPAPDRRLAAAAAPDAVRPPLSVAVMPLQVRDGFTVERGFYGEVRSRQRSDLSFEFAGRLIEIRVDEGDRVSAGAPLARVDTSLLEVELQRLAAVRDALESEFRVASRRLARQERLRADGYAPDEVLDRAESDRDRRRAQIAEVDAQIDATRIRIEKSVLRAPYAGTIAAHHADLGTTLEGGQPVLSLVDTENLEIRVGLPDWVVAQPGVEWSVAVAGRRHAAVLRSFLPEISPITRTRVALLSLEAPDVTLGAIARVRIPQRIPGAGAWVPREALIEGRAGQWSLLTLDAHETVRRVAVDVLHAEDARLFVAGALRDGMPVIASGPHRVVPGQRVAPRSEAR